MAAGDFSNAQLLTARVKLEQFWADARTTEDPNYSVATINAIARNQRVQVRPLNNEARCQDVSVVWLKGWDDSTAATATNASCAITADQTEAGKKDYAPNFSRHKSFVVWDDDCKGMYSYEEKVARGFFDATQALEKYLNKASLTFLDANATANLFTGTYGTIAGTETSFPESQWNARLMAHLVMTGGYNNIDRPVFITGQNMWEEWWTATVARNQDSQKDKFAMLNAFGNWNFDIKAMESTLAEDATIMFDPGDVAFFNKNFYTTETPFVHGDTLNTRTFKIPSLNITWNDNGVNKPVWFDVRSQVECKLVDGVAYFGTKFDVMLKGGLITSPVNINNASSGILKFLKVPDPAP